MSDVHIFLFPFQQTQLKFHFFHITEDDKPYKPYKRGRFQLKRSHGWLEVILGIKSFHFDLFLCNYSFGDTLLTISFYQKVTRRFPYTSGFEMIRYIRIPSLLGILRKNILEKRWRLRKR